MILHAGDILAANVVLKGCYKVRDRIVGRGAEGNPQIVTARGLVSGEEEQGGRLTPGTRPAPPRGQTRISRSDSYLVDQDDLATRDGEAEHAALAGRAAHPDLAAVERDDVLDDRQPQAGSALLARAGLVDSIEALEDPGLVFGRDAGTGIGDFTPDSPVGFPQAHRD